MPSSAADRLEAALADLGTELMANITSVVSSACPDARIDSLFFWLDDDGLMDSSLTLRTPRGVEEADESVVRKVEDVLYESGSSDVELNIVALERVWNIR